MDNVDRRGETGLPVGVEDVYCDTFDFVRRSSEDSGAAVVGRCRWRWEEDTLNTDGDSDFSDDVRLTVSTMTSSLAPISALIHIPTK